MCSRPEIESRICICESRLSALRVARDAELAKPLLDRSVQFLRFLERETSVYSFAVELLTELRSL
jgi:hypothetical protein